MALRIIDETIIKTLAGAGASTAITLSSAWLTLIGERAEEEFCADTGKDWIASEASIPANVLGKVKKGIGAKAAIEVVQYDSTNYFSKAEQETLLDVLTDNYNQAVEVMGKLDITDITRVNE